MRRRLGGMLATLGLAVAGAGCGHAPGAMPVVVPPPPFAVPTPLPVTYPVGLRILRLHRGSDRPLPTLLFYPAAARAPIR
ncbi:MAG: chlorophyllase, partial [Catenulispora sp.]